MAKISQPATIMCNRIARSATGLRGNDLKKTFPSILNIVNDNSRLLLHCSVHNRAAWQHGSSFSMPAINQDIAVMLQASREDFY